MGRVSSSMRAKGAVSLRTRAFMVPWRACLSPFVNQSGLTQTGPNRPVVSPELGVGPLQTGIPEGLWFLDAVPVGFKTHSRQPKNACVAAAKQRTLGILVVLRRVLGFGHRELGCWSERYGESLSS